MKTCKRVTAVLLCAIMLIGVLPMGAFAKNSNENGYSAYADDISISGVDGFGSVISKVASNSAGEDTDYGIDKFYIVQDNISYVKYHTLIDCKIVIAIYADDSDKMLGSGVLDVSAEETEVNIEIDIDLAVKQSNENPVYYIEYANARICSILNNYKEKIEKIDKYNNLKSEDAYTILNKLTEFEDIVSSSAKKQEPHLIANYVYDLATLFHSFYTKEKIITDNELETKEKINLLLTIQIVIQNALNLLGIIPREEM